MRRDVLVRVLDEDLVRGKEVRRANEVADEHDGVGGAGAFFLLLDEPEVYGLPPDPVDTVRDLGSIWKATGAAALALGAGLAAVVFGGRR